MSSVIFLVKDSFCSLRYWILFMNNSENSGKKKVLRKWIFSLFQFQWFIAVEETVLLGIDCFSKIVFYVFPLMSVFLLSLPEYPIWSTVATKISFKLTMLSLLKLLEYHWCIGLFDINRKLLAIPQSNFSTTFALFLQFPRLALC